MTNKLLFKLGILLCFSVYLCFAATLAVPPTTSTNGTATTTTTATAPPVGTTLPPPLAHYSASGMSTNMTILILGIATVWGCCKVTFFKTFVRKIASRMNFIYLTILFGLVTVGIVFYSPISGVDYQTLDPVHEITTFLMFAALMYFSLVLFELAFIYMRSDHSSIKFLSVIKESLKGANNLYWLKTLIGCQPMSSQSKNKKDDETSTKTGGDTTGSKKDVETLKEPERGESGGSKGVDALQEESSSDTEASKRGGKKVSKVVGKKREVQPGGEGGDKAMIETG